MVAIERTESRLFELVDGTLVEKPMGYKESALAVAIASALREVARPGKLGMVTGESGMIQLFPGLIRMPDVAYVSRQRLPGGKVPAEPAPALVPHLAVEVLSESNTSAEMKRKRREYFTAGVTLVWEVSPPTRTVAVYTSEADSRTLTENDTLDAGVCCPTFGWLCASFLRSWMKPVARREHTPGHRAARFLHQATALDSLIRSMSAPTAASFCSIFS